jgi:hypothetical protein
MKINIAAVLNNKQTNIKHTNKNKKHTTTPSSELHKVFLKGQFLFKFFNWTLSRLEIHINSKTLIQIYTTS